jgi:hypothetical protein
VLLSEGEGDVRILSRLYETEFRQGVSLNHQGSVQLYCDAAKSCGYFTFGDSDNLGPNVTNLTTAGYSANTSSNRVRIASGVVLTVQNVSICQEGAKSYLTGPGRLRVDATTGARTAKMTIRAGDDLVVEKVGGYELVVSQTTNISHLVVQEGVVRFTENCVVEDLQMAAGAKIVADGCCVTLKNAELLNVSAETVNGGEIAVARTGRTVAYDSSLSGNLSFAGGTTVFSRHGIDKKYWRWTVTDVGSSPYPLRLRALYLFHGESWQNQGLDFVDAVNTEENLSALGEKKFRVICHPSTNLAVAAAADRESYQALQYIKTWFTVANGGNNYPKFVSPRINPADETSHVKIVMRLDDAALPITGYNLRTVHATGAGTPTAWRVEASDDGAAWTLVDTRQDAATPGKAYYTYDGVSYIKNTFNAQELFRFAGYRTDGLTPGGAPLQLTLSAGAVVDLRAFTGGQEVDAVTVDADALAGGGEIFGAKLAEKGVLTVKNLSALPASGLLPLRLPDVVEGGSLVKWTVRDETRERPYKAVVLEDGTVRLLAMGTCILLQ